VRALARLIGGEVSGFLAVGGGLVSVGGVLVNISLRLIAIGCGLIGVRSRLICIGSGLVGVCSCLIVIAGPFARRPRRPRWKDLRMLCPNADSGGRCLT